MTKVTDKQCADAVATLHGWQGGSLAELARVANVSRVAAFKWSAAGKVGEGAAVLLGNLPGCPLTPQQIRPDLPADFDRQYLTKETKEAIRLQAAYIKTRDKTRVAAETAAAKELLKAAAKPVRRLAKRVKS